MIRGGLGIWRYRSTSSLAVNHAERLGSAFSNSSGTKQYQQRHAQAAFWKYQRGHHVWDRRDA